MARDHAEEATFENARIVAKQPSRFLPSAAKMLSEACVLIGYDHRLQTDPSGRRLPKPSAPPAHFPVFLLLGNEPRLRLPMLSARRQRKAGPAD